MPDHAKQSPGPWLVLGLPVALGLQVAYDDEEVCFRYRWPADAPFGYHDLLRYQDGEWIRYGRSPIGPDPNNTYEDRATMLVDDGSVPE